MEKEQSNFVALAEKCKAEVMSLARYIPWLESSARKQVSDSYGGDDLPNSIHFPVYDANLMQFVKEASRTSFMNRNHPYVYTRNHINGAEDELRLIRNATMKDWEILCGILSHYVLIGMRRGDVWTQGVSNGVFLETLMKMKELVLFWAEKEAKA